MSPPLALTCDAFISYYNTSAARSRANARERSTEINAVFACERPFDEINTTTVALRPKSLPSFGPTIHMADSSSTILIVPGVNNSGPSHWQSLWQDKYRGARRVNQRNWDWPECDEWTSELGRTLADAPGDVVLVAHSLGCLTVAHWADRDRGKEAHRVRGALLVAPVDLEEPEYPPGVGGFTPLPATALPFPSITVGSTDDDYCAIKRAEEFARSWGSRFVNAGAAGHINAASGYGEWPAGEELLRELL